MLIKPNKTPITATILGPLDENQAFDIVILSIPGKIVLPSFLWTGKLIEIDGKNLETDMSIEKGRIISAEIEVYGDPFKQRYFLHSISSMDSEEE